MKVSACIWVVEDVLDFIEIYQDILKCLEMEVWVYINIFRWIRVC